METSHIRNISDMSDETLMDFAVTPESLNMMKLRNSVHSHERGDFGDSGFPNGYRRLSETLKGMDLAKSAASRSSRQVSSSTRRSSTMRHALGHAISMELSPPADGRFYAFMDLIANASREASSMKEIWATMVREREAWAYERQELLEQCNEVTEILDRTENEQDHHGQELLERKKQIDSLFVQLSSTLNTIAEHKQKAIERDQEISRNRNELHELRESRSRLTMANQNLKSDYEALDLRLKASENERETAVKANDRYQDEIRVLNRDNANLKSKVNESTQKLEIARKEVLNWTDRFNSSELDRERCVAEKERAQEILRTANGKLEETTSELVEIKDRIDSQSRELSRKKVSIQELELERDQMSTVIAHLRNDMKNKTATADEMETRLADMTANHEHVKREQTNLKERLINIEREKTEQQILIEKISEESRLSSVELIQVKDDVDMWRNRCNDKQRLLSNMQDSLHMVESTLNEVRTEAQNLTDRLSHAEHEGNEAREQSNRRSLEITQLKEKFVIVQGEARTACETRDRQCEELRELRNRYEEITETVTDHRDSSAGYEFEIENLRTMLREARDQKESAIGERKAADRKRDEAIARLEEKCREMERFEQNASRHFHAIAKADASHHHVSRTVTRSNTTGPAIHNGTHSHMGNGEGHTQESSGD